MSLMTASQLLLFLYDVVSQEASLMVLLDVSLSLQVRIQDLVKGGTQLLRPKVADIAKRSRTSEASILWPGPGPA